MDLQQAINQYKPSSEVLELVRHTKVVLLVGIAGAGKDTLKKELLKKADFKDIVSHTTRISRKNSGVEEVDGVDYHFITINTAASMVQSHEFVEVKYVHGTIYGTSAKEVKNAYETGKIAITDLDVQGVDEYKEFSRDVIAIFILPPSFDVWLERLKERYASLAEFNVEWPKRRESAIRELTHALEVPYYHFIINGELARTAQVADEIAHKPDVFHRKDDEARLAARDLLEAIKANS